MVLALNSVRETRVFTQPCDAPVIKILRHYIVNRSLQQYFKATKQSYSEGGGGLRGEGGGFTYSIQNGLFKPDILDIMELYGLISKFSSSSSKDYQVVEYFVPAQLRYKTPISWSVQGK